MPVWVSADLNEAVQGHNDHQGRRDRHDDVLEQRMVLGLSSPPSSTFSYIILPDAQGKSRRVMLILQLADGRVKRSTIELGVGYAHPDPPATPAR